MSDEPNMCVAQIIIQGCPEAAAHDNIASYSAQLRHLLLCQIQKIFFPFQVNSEKLSNIDNCMTKCAPNKGIFSQKFLGEDPQIAIPRSPFIGYFNFLP